jgi:serine phosphatase RsbU (regulator of sigma subunit)
MGPIVFQLVDIGTLVFLLSIAVVMFFRFSRVSREQARAAGELAAAREIQRHLVPAVLPSLPNYTIEAAYLPAHEVGGDFYQVLPQTDGSVLVVIGDVSGKGLRAAMTSAFAIGALHALAAEISDPPQLLSRLNREILRGQDRGFITCLCIKLSPSGQMTMSNAGHLPPYRDGEELISEGGPPLGLFPDLIYSGSRFEINCGNSLTLLSDGVVEATDSKDELFGFERTKALSSHSAHDIAAAAQQFGQEDDITVVKLKHTPVEPCTSWHPGPSSNRKV